MALKRRRNDIAENKIKNASRRQPMAENERSSHKRKLTARDLRVGPRSYQQEGGEGSSLRPLHVVLGKEENPRKTAIIISAYKKYQPVRG